MNKPRRRNIVCYVCIHVHSRIIVIMNGHRIRKWKKKKKIIHREKKERKQTSCATSSFKLQPLIIVIFVRSNYVIVRSMNDASDVPLDRRRTHTLTQPPPSINSLVKRILPIQWDRRRVFGHAAANLWIFVSFTKSTHNSHFLRGFCAGWLERAHKHPYLQNTDHNIAAAARRLPWTTRKTATVRMEALDKCTASATIFAAKLNTHSRQRREKNCMQRLVRS